MPGGRGGPGCRGAGAVGRCGAVGCRGAEAPAPLVAAGRPGRQHAGMERGSPAEPRRAPRPPKQRGRAQAPAESPEAGGPPAAAAARGPHAVLEGKVKALKEKRGAGRPGGPAPTPERPSPKKPRPRRAKPGPDAAAEPRAPLRTYLTDGLLDGGAGPAGAPAAARRSGGPWRIPADGSGLSLAQRVERNRRLLQEVLALAPGRPPASDVGWDSGVSLPDAEGCRAFVPGPELALSPRHEQAKQLLQRARMKARTNPLRASHDLLPAGAPARREPGGTPAPERKQRDGEAPGSGSLSDSSSGESGCGPRRARGPSPSRVRFEDESARDAEARYLERLQLRPRRALGSALGALGPPLRQPRGGERPSRGDAAGPGGAPSAAGTCRACGSYLGDGGGAAAAGGPGERKEAAAAPAEPRAGPLGPRGSPLWILPSRQRIRTEKIKETYIRDVTCGDEADSALESTDTSDGCRTDSEEGGARPAGRGPPRPRWPHGPAAGEPELEPRGADGTRDSSSRGPEGAAGGPEAPSPRAASPRVLGQAEGGPEPSAAAPERAPRSPRRLPDSPLGALSTNNCNNTGGRGPGGAAGGGARQAPGPAGAEPPAATAVPEPPSSREGGSPSAAGLRKLLGSLSQSTKRRLGRFRCYSMEQLAAPGPAAPGVQKSPSLQSLRLASPFCQRRKASSVQHLPAPADKAPRAGAYAVAEPGHGSGPTAAGSKGGPAPRRSLSAEDIGAPALLRTVGRVLEVFPDGTSQLELQRPPDGTFGFRVASGHGRPDTGVYVQEMADASTAKLYAGLLGVGDEILQVNGAAVSGLGLAHIRELLLRADTLSLRVLRQRPARR
ncbi:uncharacterized protein KIAA1614 homolog [Rhea pennata]|uniref:uncharacterized protein KIAA1614 homolog n=1 Tax=Rhea pennata TaxID=8795 RepID=UPI002E25FBCA